MDFDLEEAQGWILDELARKRPVDVAMAELIARCAGALPHPDWAKLRALPYGDLAPMAEWLSRTFREEPPKSPLTAIYFGLFNPCPDGRNPVADMHVLGSERFPDDDQWAVEPEWAPKRGEANSEVLAAIYRIAYRTDVHWTVRDGELGNDAEYPLVLGYGAFVVRELLAGIEPGLVLGKSKAVGVAVGFDSGDIVLVGEMTRAGLKGFGEGGE